MGKNRTRAMYVLLSSTLFISPIYISAQNKITADSIKIKKEEKTVLLNATDANKPREIPIGLPSEDVNVYENGLPVVYSSSLHNVATHWRAESSLGSVGIINPTESAITTGNIAYAVSSFSRLGTKKFEGIVNYNGNHYGLQQFDMSMSGSLTKDWLYSGSIYQNFDPGAFQLRFTDFQDRMQIYKGAVTKKVGEKGEISVVYKYTNDSRAGYLSCKAPFIYVGDGSVKEVPNFDLGTSSYLPEDGVMKYRDLLSGKEYTTNFRDGMTSFANDVTLLGNYKFNNTLKLNCSGKYAHANIKFTDVGGFTITDILNGIEQNADGTPNTGNTKMYYDTDGQLFSGKKQGGAAYFHIGKTDEILFTGELTGRLQDHKWRIGLNEWYYKASYHSNTTVFDRTVEKYPSLIAHKENNTGSMQSYYNYNLVASEYYDGYENRLAAYFSDEWKPVERLKLYYGGRLEYYKIDLESLPFDRYADFYVGSTNGNGEKIEPVSTSRNNLNYAFTLQADYNLSDNLSIMGDITQTSSRPRINNYASSGIPEDKAVRISLARGGLSFNNKWIKATSMITFISKSNNYSFVNISNPKLNTDSKTAAFNYNIQTLGWTTTVEVSPLRNFNLKYLVTIQKPQYKDYETTVTFDSDTYTVSATNKIVTGISRVLMEIEPSYAITENLSAWMSLRYFGKQYANLTNALYFNSRWETFVGVNYTVNKYLSLKASVVNFLNQTGATGDIAGSELISKEDAYKYNNYWMSGDYLRPFTVEFGASIKF